MTAKYEHIATITLDSSASSVTFSSIPQGYRDLELIVSTASDTGTNNVNIYLNSDTGNNYFDVTMNGDGSATESNSTTNRNEIRLTVGVNMGTSLVSFNVQFMDYSATDKHKTALERFSDGNNFTLAGAHRWANTSAITNLEMAMQTNKFASGSTFDLYGIVGGA